MPFEVGKLYTFKENEFEKSRESGRLVFKIKDPASATPYIVKPFEFQISELPSKIICRYKGNDRFEQDQNAIVPELYEVGKEYRFRVMRQDNKAAAHVSLRDDARGLTFFPVDLGKVKFERFQRITCRVVSTDNGDLKLAYVKDNREVKTNFSIEQVAAQRGGRLLGREQFIARLMANPMFDEVKLRQEQGNMEWLLSAMEVMTRNITLWFVRGNRFRSDLLEQLRTLAVTLIEHTDYLNIFPQEERRTIQSRLTEVVLNSEDYLEASRLIGRGEDEEFITSTLDSLKSTGWLYRPEQKMRLMMALFTLRNGYVHRYIPQLFRIIREHHSDERFLGEFTDGFIKMLGIFIENESKFVNTSSHDVLRELIEAIAIQLLLTQDRDYKPWNLYRGRMYTLAMLLVGDHTDALAAKAFNALTDNFDVPLEYVWKDLDDINRLCHVKLNSPANLNKSADRRKQLSIFEGENATLAVSDSAVTVTPATTGPDTRIALSLPLASMVNMSVYLNEKLPGKIPGDSDELSKHHVMWRDLEKSLLSPQASVAVAATAQRAQEKARKKMPPTVDDEVLFSVVSMEENDQFTFRCIIEDPAFEGEGVINTRDIVSYPVSPYADTFGENGVQMLLKGRVIGVREDGLYRLSVEEDADREIMSMATEDRDEENEMDAIITKDLGQSCLAVTEWGYPVIIYKRDRDLYQGQKVVVRISEVSWNKKQNKPFISAVCVEADEYSDKVANYRAVRAAFGNLLKQLSHKRPEQEPAEGAEHQPAADAPGQEFEALPDVYISEEAVSGLSRLFDAMAYVDHDNITAVYTYLACSRLLALLAGDNYRAQFIGLKQALVEVLSRFAIDGRVDTDVLSEISLKVKKFPGSDADLQRRMATLNILATLDSPAADTSLSLAQEVDSPILNSLRRLVVAHNMLRGLKLNPVRAELKRSIYDLLNLNMPYVDVSRVNATEDQYHEFKESLIYPAGNAMKPDEKKQGLEIAQVICGMLNSGGGTLYIGVANTGVPRGLAEDFVYINNGFEEYDIQDVKDKFGLKFCSVLREHLGLVLDGIPVYPSLVSLEFDDIDDHVFAVVSVRPYKGAVRLADGSMFIRQDSSTLPVKKKADQLALDKSRRGIK